VPHNVIWPRHVFPLKSVLQLWHLKPNKSGNVRVNVILRGVRVTIVTVEKHCIFWVCVCVCLTLVIQHAKRVRPIILSSVACSALTCFPTIFGKNVLNVKFLFWISIPLCLKKFLTLKKIRRDFILHIRRFSRTLLMTWILCTN